MPSDFRQTRSRRQGEDVRLRVGVHCQGRPEILVALWDMVGYERSCFWRIWITCLHSSWYVYIYICISIYIYIISNHIIIYIYVCVYCLYKVWDHQRSFTAEYKHLPKVELTVPTVATVHWDDPEEGLGWNLIRPDVIDESSWIISVLFISHIII